MPYDDEMRDSTQANRTATVMLTRRTWTAVLGAVIDNLLDHIEQRTPDTTDDDLEVTIQEVVQKLLPVLRLAADELEFPEIGAIYREAIARSGYATPEHFEDLAKQLVRFN